MLGEAGEGGGDIGVESGVAASDAVGGVSVAGPGALLCLGFGEREEEGSVGEEVGAADAVEGQYVGVGEVAHALIGAAAVEEPVGQHPCAAIQRGADRLFDMIGASGGEKERFGAGVPAVGGSGEEEGADGFGAFAAAGFAGFHDFQALGAQGGGEGAELRRFTGALPALQSDEPAACHPKKDFRPFQRRPKMPASDTSSPATRGRTCGGVSGVETISSATFCPFAMGALIGPV